MNKNKSVLVTGANGFVGSHVIKSLLNEGYKNVFGLIRSQKNISHLHGIKENVNWIIGDVLDIFSLEEAMSSADIVIHAAAIVSYDPKAEKNIYITNETGTANVVNVASKCGIEKVIHVSSIAALGRKKDDFIIDENAIWTDNPYNTAYAKSKYLAEQQVWRAFYEGLPVTIVNPSVILGIGDWNSSSLQFLPKLKNGALFYPLGSTGFVDVEDVAKIIVTAIDEKYNGERYILNSDNLSYFDFFNNITEKLGSAKPKIKLTPLWRAIGWRIEALRSFILGTEPLLTKETAQSSSLPISYDNSKSIKSFNFNYKPLSQTIETMTQAFINSHS